MIKIYTIPSCSYCSELKQILTSEGIEFSEINVNLPENQDEYEKITEITKSDQVPIIRVKSQLLVPNVSFNTIVESVSIIKKFLG